MSDAVLAEAARLAEAGRPFVLATVVWRRGPSSGRQGAKAIIGVDGRLRGWIGGACAEPTVVREALMALTDGRPRLMQLGPPDDFAGRSPAGITSVPMACESEGAMEVFLEPVVPARHVVVIGRSPAVDMLARLAVDVGWRSTVVDDGGREEDHPGVSNVSTSLDLEPLAIDARTFVVIATQGHYDEAALQAVLGTAAGYVGLVASRKRADGIAAFLRDRGVSDEALARVHAPAGIDLGAGGDRALAVSIMAELVAIEAGGRIPTGVSVALPAEAIDPVCGMTVDPATARLTAEHAGTTYYFCSSGCREAFIADPHRYLEPA